MHIFDTPIGHAHSKQRKIMNPVFSVNHMRHMAPLFFDIGHKVCVTDIRDGTPRSNVQ